MTNFFFSSFTVHSARIGAQHNTTDSKMLLPKFLLLTLAVVAQSALSENAKFHCPGKMARSPILPTSVHKLRPADVKVVAAMGDSLAAEIAALRKSYRGLSFSIGGQASVEKYTTLPDILKRFNPEIIGFVIGPDSHDAQPSTAVAGAFYEDLGDQARKLVKLMKSSKEIDYSHDWKVVTLLVSAHDLCEDCQNKETRSPDNYVASIRAALDMLKAEMPRTFVNLVPVMSMHLFHRNLADNRTECERIGFKYSSRSCACNGTAGGEEPAELQGTNPDYTPLTRGLVGDGRYDNHDAFTVVLQPFMQEFLLPKQADGEPDLSYFAPDCFHLGEKVHEKAAIGLWNSMIEPVGKKAKQTDWQKGEPLKCPTVEYLPTTKNTYDLSGSCSVQHRWRSATFLDIQDSLFCWRHS